MDQDAPCRATSDPPLAGRQVTRERGGGGDEEIRSAVKYYHYAQEGRRRIGLTRAGRILAVSAHADRCRTTQGGGALFFNRKQG